MPAELLNLNVLAHEANRAMAMGYRVAVKLENGTELFGQVTRIDEDLARKPEVTRGDGRRTSHLIVVLNQEGSVPLERIRKLEPG